MDSDEDMISSTQEMDKPSSQAIDITSSQSQSQCVDVNKEEVDSTVSPGIGKSLSGPSGIEKGKRLPVKFVVVQKDAPRVKPKRKVKHAPLVSWVEREKDTDEEEDDGATARFDPRPFKKLYIPAELEKHAKAVNASLKHPGYDEKFREWLYGKEQWQRYRTHYFEAGRPKPIGATADKRKIQDEADGYDKNDDPVPAKVSRLDNDAKE